MEIIEIFLKASSRDDIFKNLDRVCKELGFDYCVYSPLFGVGNSQKVFQDDSRVIMSEALIAQDTLINCPDSWLYRYQEAQYFQSDPIVEHVLKSPLPIVWDDVARYNPKNSVLNEASEHGLRHGITVSTNGSDGQRSIMSFSKNSKMKESRDQVIVTASLIQLTANFVHEALQRLNRYAIHMHVALSVREKDCLKWAACGKTSWEIGMILGVSERTVIFHLTNATRKLQANNRREAVVRALSFRLISI